MAVKELEKKSVKDLEKDLAKKRKSLKDFRFGISGSKAKDSNQGSSLRKGIARILTELNSRKNKA